VSARALAKRSFGALAASPPLHRRTRLAFAARVNIVYYHYVGYCEPYYADFYAGTTLARLDRDLSRLERRFAFAPLADVVAGRAPRGGKPPLAVTFDDGFDLVAPGTLDVLERHGVRATTFVITGCLDNAGLMWRNKLSATRALCGDASVVRGYREVAASHGLAPIATADELMAASRRWPMARKDELADALWRACSMPALDAFLAEHRPYMGWRELDEWIERGHGVGLHTRTHPYCARLEPGDVRGEIEEPAALLRSRLQLDWLALSYPFGSRLGPAVERELFEARVFDCALGIEGFARAGTAPYRLERASAERHLDFEVFGRTLAGLPR
jgi:peptidoglycan/xylan/chitin deacetylase (PgdA/CDA1 family)